MSIIDCGSDDADAPDDTPRMHKKNGQPNDYVNMQLGFAKRVRLARLAAGYTTQELLGDAIGKRGSSVSNWERSLQWSSPPDLYKLAKTLGVTMDWLVAGDEGGLTLQAKRRLECALANISSRPQL